MNQLIFGVPLRYILCFCIHHSIFFLPLICDKTGQVTGDVLNTSVWVVIHFPWYCAFMHACKHGSSLSPKPEPRAEQSTMMINPVCVRLIECRSQSVVGPETIAGSNHVKGGCRSPWPYGYCSAAYQDLKDGGDEWRTPWGGWRHSIRVVVISRKRQTGGNKARRGNR